MDEEVGHDDLENGKEVGSPTENIEEVARKMQAEQRRKHIADEHQALRQLWKLYSDSVLDAEKTSFFEHFGCRPITAEEFESRPQVLLLGQYSTGKTSMVKWLTGSRSPHFDVRPQPSTDKFIAVVHGDQERLIHGNAAACLQQLPYQGLSVFGGSFLASFQALSLPSEVLKEITLVDTPGVLAGSKQRIGRDYDFAEVAAWMAERADMVLLTFDAHKLDISDEFQEVMEVLRPYADKVRCVLNKADQIDAKNLVKVYGALLWNCGKVLRTPEVARVFVSSFWDKDYRFKEHASLFEEDKQAILEELHNLPRATLLRKTHNLVARIRRMRAHYCIMTHIQSQVPWRLRALGSEAQIRRWIDNNVGRLFDEVKRLRNLSIGDLPKKEDFREKLWTLEGIRRLPCWDAEVMQALDQAINEKIPEVINKISGVTASDMGLAEKDEVGDQGRRGFWDRLNPFGGETSTRKRKREES